jgi:uncharacterized protein (TIGR02147 family)
MSNVNIYEFHDYKAYLKKVEASRSKVQRGFRTRIAEATGTQSAYISQVLNGHMHFSLEQAWRISELLNLNQAEINQFLLLIEYARAGHQELQQHFLKLMNESREKNLNLKERISEKFMLTPEAQTIYYTQWYFAAIHILVTIPKFRTPVTIANTLNLNIHVTTDAIVFLISCGLLIEKKGEVYPGPAQLHLGKDSPNLVKHLSNWRIKSIQNLEKHNDKNLYYSTISSLSKKDVEKIRDKFVQVIEEYVGIVKDSKEEALYSFNLDFFNLLD